MNKTEVATDQFSVRSSPRLSSSIREVDWPIPTGMGITDLVELFTQVENGLSADGGSIVQFVSISAGCNSERVAFDMAWAGAAILGRDVLVLNAAGSLGGLPYGIWRGDEPRSAEVAQETVGKAVSLEDHLVKVAGHGLYLADMNTACGGRNALKVTNEVVISLRKLSVLFDMIVVVSPPTDDSPFGVTLARHVDGNILVVEAEKTRRSAASKMCQILARSGRPLLGAVLNNEKRHVPNWLAP